MSVNLLMRLYLPAIAPEVKGLFTKSSWYKEDFLSLPCGVEEDGEQGERAGLAGGGACNIAEVGLPVYVLRSTSVTT